MATTLLEGVSWTFLVVLFLVSLMTVFGWAFQYTLGKRAFPKISGSLFRHSKRLVFPSPWWDSLLKLSIGEPDERDQSEAGMEGLVKMLLSFGTMREHCQQAWLEALNEQAVRSRSSILINFGESLQFPGTAVIESMRSADQSAHSMVLHCSCSMGMVTFPVTVTQQPPAAASVDIFQVTLSPVQAQMVVYLEEVEKEGLLVSWTFSQQPLLSMTVLPNRVLQEQVDRKADMTMVGEMVKKIITNTQPAIILRLRTSESEHRGVYVKNRVPTPHRRHHTQTEPQVRCRQDLPSHSPFKTKVEQTETPSYEMGYHADVSPTPRLESCHPNGFERCPGPVVQQLTGPPRSTVRATVLKKVTLKALRDEGGATPLPHKAVAMDTSLPGENPDSIEQPSTHDPGWESGSVVALETRSLKDHKGGSVRSSSRLLLRRRPWQKEPVLSRSHEDVADTSSGCSPRRRSSSFSRRLIKRFSLRSKSGGGKGSTDGGLG